MFHRLYMKLRVERYGPYYIFASIALIALAYVLVSNYVRAGNSRTDGGDGTSHLSDRITSYDSDKRYVNPALKSEIEEADLSVLFIGNQLTSQYDIPDMVKQLILSVDPDRKVCIVSRTNQEMELTGHATSIETTQFVEAGKWDYIV